MHNVRFFSRSVWTVLAKLCRKGVLLLLLTALIVGLPICIAPAAEQLLSQGVSFSGITLAITAPEGDPVPQLLEELLPGMEDISQYCQVKAMDRTEALESLERGDVTAVLALPEGFVHGILYGENPDVELIVPANRPLESLLTLWVGQSACDILASFQSGIYAVLDLYQSAPPADLSYDQVVSQINLRYISWTLSRQDLFRVEKISVTGQLPIGLHYGLSLLCFLTLALVPFFYCIFSREHLQSYRRLISVGRTPAGCFLSSVTACWTLLFGVLLLAVSFTIKGSWWQTVALCALGALFCTAFAALCCLITENSAQCGIVSSLLSLLFLALSGGILPPVMLPKHLRAAMAYSPVTWLREMLAVPAGYDPQGSWLYLVIAAVILLILSLLLFRRRMMQEVART